MKFFEAVNGFLYGKKCSNHKDLVLQLEGKFEAITGKPRGCSVKGHTNKFEQCTLVESFYAEIDRNSSSASGCWMNDEISNILKGDTKEDGKKSKKFAPYCCELVCEIVRGIRNCHAHWTEKKV